MNKFLFYGGTGQCKVMRPIADELGKLVAIVDDTKGLKSPFYDVDIYDNLDECLRKCPTISHFVVTIGNPNGKIRKEKSFQLKERGLRPFSLIHERAFIDEYVSLGEGLQIHYGAIVGVKAMIKDWCIINTCANVEHDCILNDSVEIGPGAVVCGEVEIGENTWIGAGSVVRQKIKIGKNVIVGAGSVVVKDIPDNFVVVGNPAKFLKVNPRGQ